MRIELGCIDLVISGLLLTCLWTSSASCQELYFVAKGDTILAGEDIESYGQTSHRLALTEAGFAKWKSYEHLPPPEGRTLAERTLLTDRHFAVSYAGEVVAEGSICSGTESKLQCGLNIFDNLTGTRRSRLKLGYFRFEPHMPPDPLESEAFLEYFRKNGKLVEEEE